ncbi:hypothetical protein [Alienimonas chondri]|uniref:Outer membrane lipoprotein-sorting protein n=1 Tax=Alienimonas chondri TaxID=2681879 RepID=A0ABX1VH98_9PLAN|nr:hypothetical protein [Alienimonas chondri]NNJ26633.1 hypothetical protein [Alienimonas chondri]
MAAFALLATTAFSFPAGAEPPADAGEAKLAEVLEGLRQAEQRPRMGTLRWASEYVLNDDAGFRGTTRKITVTGSESDLADAWRVDVRRESWEPTNTGPIDAGPTEVGPEAVEPDLEVHFRRNVSCYDGIKTLQAVYPEKDSQYPTVELHAGNVPSRDRLNPYMLLFNRGQVRASLSQWLGGELAPGDESFVGHNHLWTPRYLRTEQIDGIQVHVVSVEYRNALKPKGPALWNWTLHLAPERDYLPVKVEYWNPYKTPGFPTESIVLSDLVQADDGRWFPRRAVQGTTNAYATRSSDELKIASTTTYTMDWRPDELIDRSELCKDTAPKGGWPGSSVQQDEEPETQPEGERD